MAAHADNLVQHTLETRYEELEAQKEDLIRENSALKKQFSTLRGDTQKNRGTLSGKNTGHRALLAPEEMTVVEGVVVASSDPKNIMETLRENIRLLSKQVEALEEENRALKERINRIGDIAEAFRAIQ